MLSITKNQTGDTMVEVLIAIVVVSMVLVAGYVTTTRSMNGMQDTEEHSEALQLAQTQLEYLHDASTLPTGNDCYSNSGTLTSGNGCLVNSSGNPTTAQPQFNVAITAVNPSTFEVSVTWPSIANSGITDNVTLYYQP